MDIGTHLARNWSSIMLRGILSILFGLLALFLPGVTLTVLVILFGAYAFVDGVFALATAMMNHSGASHTWLLVLEGIVSIAAGVVTFLWPGITAFALVYIIAAWAILTGIFEIMAAIRLRKSIEGEWILGLSGALSVIFGVIVSMAPVTGALAIVWMIGLYALFFGALLIGLAMRLHRHPTQVLSPV